MSYHIRKDPDGGLGDKIVENLIIAGLAAFGGWVLENIIGPKLQQYFSPEPEGEEVAAEDGLTVISECPDPDCDSSIAILIDCTAKGIKVECRKCSTVWEITKQNKHTLWVNKGK